MKRDEDSGALLSTDGQGLKRYKETKLLRAMVNDIATRMRYLEETFDPKEYTDLLSDFDKLYDRARNIESDMKRIEDKIEKIEECLENFSEGIENWRS